MGDGNIRERIEALRLVLLSGRGPSRAPAGERRVRRGLEPEGWAGMTEHAREVSGRHGKCLLIERDAGQILGPDAPADQVLLEAYGKLLPRPPGDAGDAEGSKGPGSPADSVGSGGSGGRGCGGCGGDGPAAAAVFLDLETTGLSATPLFLAGALVHSDGALKAVQLLARDYSEERCLIDLLDGMLAGCGLCVTFNGKSFDLPYLRERAKYHRLELRARPEHFDLLHHARRRWKHRLPDCRLLTLEWYILGRRRMGDVGGWEVPGIYHDFVHTGDTRRLRQVLAHNLMDVLSMAQLMVSLAEA